MDNLKYPQLASEYSVQVSIYRVNTVLTHWTKLPIGAISQMPYGIALVIPTN